MPVECGICDGASRKWDRRAPAEDPSHGWCPECENTGKVLPPPPTDEQIDGREYGRCHGLRGRRGFNPPRNERELCERCNGAGRIGAVENRWVCLGGMKYPNGRAAGWLTCKGRSDIVADDATWTGGEAGLADADQDDGAEGVVAHVAAVAHVVPRRHVQPSDTKWPRDRRRDHAYPVCTQRR
jgi:hypothetical protein